MKARVIAIVLIAAAAVVAILVLRPPGGKEAGSAAQSVASTQADGAAQWSCFRGPNCGISSWTNTPVAWDGPSGKGVLWKTPLKMACVSSPIVWGDHVYITEGDDNERAVLAFDAVSGKQLWRQVVPDGGKGAPLPSVSDSGLALPTPACDANGVYAIFGTGDLAAFSHEGKPKWQIFLKRPVLGYGFASSPCVIDNLVCIQFDDYSDGRVLAVETSTGKTKWEHARSRGAAWSSPIIVRGDDGKPLFIVNANGSITAFDLTGKLAWDVDGVAGEVAPSPTWWKGHVYAVNAGSRLLCYKVSDNTKELWHRGGSLSDAASPVVVNGLFFMVTGDSRLVCLDAITGEELWKQRSPSTYASLVASGDRIYSLGRDGTMLIVAAERTYRLIATCALGEGADATPAMAANRIYIRGREHLWCIGAK